MAYIAWSILDMSGKAEAHCIASGDDATIFITAFKNLSGEPIRAPQFHKQTVCWISEFNRDSRPNDLGERNYFKRRNV